MSRPGFVFDLMTVMPESSVSYRCRNCGRTEAGGRIANSTLLHTRMKAHLTDHHQLAGSDDWKVTVQDRGASQRVACFWPPEAF